MLCNWAVQYTVINNIFLVGIIILHYLGQLQNLVYSQSNSCYCIITYNIIIIIIYVQHLHCLFLSPCLRVIWVSTCRCFAVMGVMRATVESKVWCEPRQKWSWPCCCWLKIIQREIVAQSDLRAPPHQEFRVIPHLACMGSRPLKSAHEIFEGPHYEKQRLMHADRPSPSRTDPPSLMSSHSDRGESVWTWRHMVLSET